MNKLVLIGNGFDLAHKLETRYRDFILWYLNGVAKQLRKNKTYSDNLIEANNELLFYAPKEFESIKEFKAVLKKNGFVSFRYKNDFLKKLIDHVGELNWVDIEFEYYKQLTKFYKILETDRFKENPEVYKHVLGLNECLNELKIKLSEYLTTIDSKPKEIITDIASHFKNEFGAKSIKNGESIMFLNFNYTSTLENYTDLLDHKDYSINYIHGKLNDNNNPLVFGYGDEMDEYYQKIERLNSNEFLNNIKSFYYFKTSNYKNLISFINGFQSRFRVYIMGHSCGISDRTLLNSIVENKNCANIKIYYHDKGNNQNDHFEKTQELSRHFRPDYKGVMRDKVIPLDESEALVKISKGAVKFAN